jgi:hypothetical protein
VTSKIAKSSQAEESPVGGEGHDVSVESTELVGGLTQRIEQSDVTWHLACGHDEARSVGGPLDAVHSTVFGLRDGTGDRAVKVHDEETSVAVVRGTRGVHITEQGRGGGEGGLERERGEKEGPWTWMFAREECRQREVSRTSCTPWH